ncbi:MAG: YpdA family putative bacillithiol disulfide reductase, partial [Bacteroidota bacterium]
MKEPILDVIIIGAGPIGLSCGIEATKADLDYLILEKGVLVNSLYNFPTNMTFFSTSVLLEIGDVPFISHNAKPTRRESLEYYNRVYQSWNLKTKFYEPVLQVEIVDGIYHVKTNKQSYQTRAIVVSTGFYDTPRLMNIKGEHLPKVKHFYDEPHPYIGQNVLVIGAANSACDVALELYYKGALVTMSVRKDSISPRVKYWIKPNIENRIKEGSITAHFNTTVEEIKEKSVVLNTPDGQLEIDNDWVLAMTGYQPNFDFFRMIGIELADDGHLTPVHNKETLETNMTNVYIA